MLYSTVQDCKWNDLEHERVRFFNGNLGNCKMRGKREEDRKRERLYPRWQHNASKWAQVTKGSSAVNTKP